MRITNDQQIIELIDVGLRQRMHDLTLAFREQLHQELAQTACRFAVRIQHLIMSDKIHLTVVINDNVVLDLPDVTKEQGSKEGK